MLRKIILFATVLLFINGIIWAQDFGFGSEDDEETSKSSASFTVGGEIYAEAIPYIYDFNDEKTFIDSSWNVKLNLAFTSPYIDVFSISNFNSNSINELWTGSSNLIEYNYTPLIIDELYFRAYISAVNIEAGYRKLTWGKVDSNGPLDVINPIDYTDLLDITDIMARKIARPMVHITWNAGGFSKLEGVFIPNFTGHRFASEGRWTPLQYSNMKSTVETGITSIATGKFKPIISSNPSYLPIFIGIQNELSSSLNEIPFTYPSTNKLDYFQAGLRFTTTISSVDLGFQYFYGNLFRPSFTIAGVEAFLDDLTYGIFGVNPPATLNLSYPVKSELISPQIKYTRYHQIGIDYAQVLFGFNIRAEAAFNLTEDFNGDDGSLQNPFIAWAFGFDRDLFWGINANVQCDETIRLFNDKVGDNPVLDSEAGTDMTSTRITLHLSKNFLRDKLESGITCVWEIENSDFYLIPSLAWKENNLTATIAAGFFTGETDGELGQYWRNRFVKLALSIAF